MPAAATRLACAVRSSYYAVRSSCWRGVRRLVGCWLGAGGAVLQSGVEARVVKALTGGHMVNEGAHHLLKELGLA